MSVVAAVVSASPVPVQVVTQVQYVTPEWVNQLATVLKELAGLALMVVPGYLASAAHNFINPKLGKWGNTLLLYGYSLVLGLLGLVAAAQLDLTKVDFANPEQVGAAVLTVIGAATLQYNRYKANHQEVATEPVAQF